MRAGIPSLSNFSTPKGGSLAGLKGTVRFNTGSQEICGTVKILTKRLVATTSIPRMAKEDLEVSTGWTLKVSPKMNCSLMKPILTPSKSAFVLTSNRLNKFRLSNPPLEAEALTAIERIGLLCLESVIPIVECISDSAIVSAG